VHADIPDDVWEAQIGVMGRRPRSGRAGRDRRRHPRPELGACLGGRKARFRRHHGTGSFSSRASSRAEELVEAPAGPEVGPVRGPATRPPRGRAQSVRTARATATAPSTTASSTAGDQPAGGGGRRRDRARKATGVTGATTNPGSTTTATPHCRRGPHGKPHPGPSRPAATTTVVRPAPRSVSGERRTRAPAGAHRPGRRTHPVGRRAQRSPSPERESP